MSRIENLDLVALRSRLFLAIEGAADLQGSLYLVAIGALYLASAPDNPAENGMWASLFELQAEEEGINGVELLALLSDVGGRS